MYSEQIDTYLQQRNYSLTQEEFEYVISDSSQITTPRKDADGNLIKCGYSFKQYGEKYSQYNIKTNDNHNWDCIRVQNK